MRFITAILAAYLALSCQVTESARSASPTPFVRTAKPVQAWLVVDGETELGSVVLFSTPGEDGAVDAFFSIRNVWQQDLGIVDEMGRAWAFRAHAQESQWVGSGTVASGAARILGASSACRLVEIALEGLDPTTRASRAVPAGDQ